MDEVYAIFRQVKVLAWKNFILKKRHISILFLELLIPTAIMMGLWGIKVANKPKFSGPDIPNNYQFSQPVNELYSDQSYDWKCTGRTLVWR